MKIVSIILGIVGAIAVVLAVVGVLANISIMHITSGGYLRGATALFLLTLVIIAYDCCYCCKEEKPKSRRR